MLAASGSVELNDPTGVATAEFSATRLFVNAIAVGASLTLVIVSVKFRVRSGVAPTAASFTLTVTL